MTDLHTLPDRVVLALCIWGESRGEPVEGQIAVGCVVRNRLQAAVNTAPRWRDVCLAPNQFSCFNPDDPNYGPLQLALAGHPSARLAQQFWIADGVMSGMVQDNTHGATHYLTTALLISHPPSWARDQPTRATIGAHSFLKVA
jgi:N-acetylmuramoyl-L-alanine amidase